MTNLVPGTFFVMDIVIPQGGLNDVAIDIIVSKIKSRT